MKKLEILQKVLFGIAIIGFGIGVVYAILNTIGVVKIVESDLIDVPGCICVLFFLISMECWNKACDISSEIKQKREKELLDRCINN